MLCAEQPMTRYGAMYGESGEEGKLMRGGNLSKNTLCSAICCYSGIAPENSLLPSIPVQKIWKIIEFQSQMVQMLQFYGCFTSD